MSQYLDQNIIAELKEIMADDLPMLFEAYLEDSSRNLNSLAQAIDTQDADQVRRIAHSIKGSSRNVGATDLALQCEQLENAAKDKILDNSQQALQNINQIFQQTSEEIKQTYLN
ncbi:Hpt domain-containing protein [Aliikangiella maris]|uniref:Hpt domain-containing protein n=2 Tax=Aliikangiella maris TaxID=3162458 RepID=A0ABV2BSZ6_9GAMM